jgi:S-phase kinase-associated protein 1
MSREITIKCLVDGTTFKTNTKDCSRSNFLKNLFDIYKTEEVIDIPDIKGSIMALIIEWFEKHRTEEPKLPPQPLRTYDFSEVVSKWEDEFANKAYNDSFDSLFAFLNAVNFLDIQPLLELMCAKTSCLVKDLSPEEFQKLFKIESDCSPEEVKKLEEEILKERDEEREKEKLRFEEEEKNKNN